MDTLEQIGNKPLKLLAVAKDSYDKVNEGLRVVLPRAISKDCSEDVLQVRDGKGCESAGAVEATAQPGVLPAQFREEFSFL